MEAYFDHAATTRILPEALAAMNQAVEEFYGNPSSIHTPGQRAKARLEEAREELAALLGVSPRELYFTSGGSEADNQAVLAGAMGGAKQGKHHLITSAFEHHAVLNPMQYLETQGFSVTYLDVHQDGHVVPEELAAAIRPDTALVSVMYVNNEVGTVQPIPALGKLCREKGVLFHTDGVQAVGHIPLDLSQVDYLSLSAHKFGGPRGVGALYVRRGCPNHRLILGGEQERGWRAGTENLPAILGMVKALELSCAMDHTATLRDRLVEGLKAIPGCHITGSGEKHPGIVHLCLEGIHSESLLLLLDRAGIYASAGSACASGALEPSHVLRAMGIPEKLASGALRLSLGPDNTAEEVEYLLRTLEGIVNRLRNVGRSTDHGTKA